MNTLLSSIDPRLADFLQREEHLIFHTPQYARFIEQSFHCDYLFAAVLEQDVVKTILPVVKVKSRLLGNRIISSAYIEYGGFAGDHHFAKQLIEFLGEEFSSDYDYLEIRGGMPLNIDNLDQSLTKANLYKRFVLTLKSKEEIWRGVQESKRKAIKKSSTSVEVRDVPFSDLDQLYHLYLKNMQRFGSPPYSKNYFHHFYQFLIANNNQPNIGKIYGSYHKESGKLLSALVGFTYGDRVHILIAVSDDQYQDLRPNDAMHWAFINWAIDHGYRYFDFGRVREDSGQYEYKRKWGGELMDLPSYFALWNIKNVSFIDPQSAKYKLATTIWKKMPLWFTRRWGMKLRKELGI